VEKIAKELEKILNQLQKNLGESEKIATFVEKNATGVIRKGHSPRNDPGGPLPSYRRLYSNG